MEGLFSTSVAGQALNLLKCHDVRLLTMMRRITNTALYQTINGDWLIVPDGRVNEKRGDGLALFLCYIFLLDLG